MNTDDDVHIQMETNMSFKADAAKIKRWREERQWSQEHLADLAGIGLRTIQRIENGGTASKDSLMALAAAFDVDVMSLCVDPAEEAVEILERRTVKVRKALFLSLWIHLASYVFGMIVFAGISLGIGGPYFVMKWPMIWWTVGAAGHALAVTIVVLATRFRESDAQSY